MTLLLTSAFWCSRCAYYLQKREGKSKSIAAEIRVTNCKNIRIHTVQDPRQTREREREKESHNIRFAKYSNLATECIIDRWIGCECSLIEICFPLLFYFQNETICTVINDNNNKCLYWNAGDLNRPKEWDTSGVDQKIECKTQTSSRRSRLFGWKVDVEITTKYNQFVQSIFVFSEPVKNFKWVAMWVVVHTHTHTL